MRKPWKTLEEQEAAEIILLARRQKASVLETCRHIAAERGYSEDELAYLVNDVEVLEALWSLEAKGEAIRRPHGWTKGRGKEMLH